MLKLIALDLNTRNDRSIYWSVKCPHCGDLFLYKSKGLFVAIWDKALFDIDYRVHVVECLSKKTLGESA